MPKCNTTFPVPLPDNPHKWEGWNNYKSPNFYERLCLDPHANPSNELIEERCRELLRWWQKKLPLKNQPSNPLAQLLRTGLDESSRYLTEARVELLDPKRRRAMDDELAAQEHEETVAEFRKYLAFAIADGTLTADEEKNLMRFGVNHGLTKSQMISQIEAELKDSGAKRAQPTPAPSVATPLPSQCPPSSNPQEEFMRILRLSALDSSGMTDDQRDAFINMAESLGIEPGEAEDLVDLYLEEADAISQTQPAPGAARNGAIPSEAREANLAETAQAVSIEINVAAERGRYVNFQNSLGGEMLFIPSAEFVMGSEAFDASPNERPLVRVTSLDAIKFCQWLSTRERKKYRLPTEAEWEYAARGTDGRKYPWGSHEGHGNLANFADRNTVFAWSDREIDDGYVESSPAGAFPLGASPFGLEDMAGNVWEWCLDYYEAYRGAPKVNPRGPAAGARRVYRGGSWKSRFNNLRATARGSNVPGYSCNDLGFRIACECE